MPFDPVDNQLVTSGKQLYDSGIFADAELIIGGQKWPVHKFKEGVTTKVDVTGQNPKFLSMILRYLYMREGIAGKLDSIIELISFAITADYFAIDDLCTKAISSFKTRIRFMHLEINLQTRRLSDEAFGDFFYAARVAYRGSSKFRALRKPVQWFIGRNRNLIFKGSPFLANILSMPELAAATLINLPKVSYSYRDNDIGEWDGYDE
ncbi:uncharacterized protein PG998_012124 [Apiospora kogelbergensis]|uniref:uncharacterized protein n=1 Tax=Apiospora kogelbergensis TaxID=1337665 RepID=UPI00312D600F